MGGSFLERLTFLCVFVTFVMTLGSIAVTENTSLLLFPVYNFWLRVNAEASDAVYRKHVNMTIHQIERNKERNFRESSGQWDKFYVSDTSTSQRFIIDPYGRIYKLEQNNIATDINGRRIRWDPAFGWTPVQMEKNSRSIVWSWTPSGWIPIATDPFNNWYPGVSTAGGGGGNRQGCDQARSDKSTLLPALSFDDGTTVDQCGEVRRDYGLTMSSGMGDIMCAFCQILKDMKCVWKFCSHPEGVYKIKYR